MITKCGKFCDVRCMLYIISAKIAIYPKLAVVVITIDSQIQYQPSLMDAFKILSFSTL